MIPREILRSDEPPQFLNFSVSNREKSTMDHREGRHSGEDIERMEMESVRQEMSGQEGF